MMPTERSAEGDVRESAREVLRAHWREPGFTCPNAGTYPWLWLWDSCFHAIVWAELGEVDRALSELHQVLAGQDRSGFVPHMRYLDGTRRFDGFWGRTTSGSQPSTSSITQPPVYALAVADLAARGVDVPAEIIERAADGLRFLLTRRRRSPAGLIEIVHPWESGCDHSPRWDDLFVPGDPGRDRFDGELWFRRKSELLSTIQRDRHGAPVANDEFPVGSVAFSAIVAHGARLLAPIAADPVLADLADELSRSLAQRWDPERRTFVDDGPSESGSGRVRTSEALLPALVATDESIVRAVAAELTDPAAFGGRFGPSQVHRGEVTFRRDSYWRGPSWPQIDHLLILALAGSEFPAGVLAAAELARACRAGALVSGWAEYWDPDDGHGGGAVPQSWSTLAILWNGMKGTETP